MGSEVLCVHNPRPTTGPRLSRKHATRMRVRRAQTLCYAFSRRMDFDEFEQLVLKVLFETDVPVTAAHVAYLGRISVRTAERHLARMVEQGTLTVRTSAAGIVEYVYPGRKPIAARAGNELTVDRKSVV